MVASKECMWRLLSKRRKRIEGLIMNFQDMITVLVTRNPQDTIQIVHTIVLVFLVFTFHYFLRKFLEVDRENRNRYYRGLVVSITFLPAIFLISFCKIEFVWLFAFVYIFIAFENFFIKALEDFSQKWLFGTVVSLVILVVMIIFSIHYPSINLQIIIKEYLGIMK